MWLDRGDDPLSLVGRVERKGGDRERGGGRGELDIPVMVEMSEKAGVANKAKEK